MIIITLIIIIIIIIIIVCIILLWGFAPSRFVAKPRATEPSRSLRDLV